jgi:hypothetical protein
VEEPLDPSCTDATSEDVGIVDAARVHAVLKELCAAGNQVRLELIRALKVVYDCRLYYELGYSYFHQYCDLELGFARSTAYEYVHTADDIERLPIVRQLFANGDLSWTQVRAITRVATPATEDRWVQFAAEELVADLLAEVRVAVQDGRDEPRDRRYGLPNSYTRITFEVTLEEKQRWVAAFAIIGSALGDTQGEGRTQDGDAEVVRRTSAGHSAPVISRLVDGVLAGRLRIVPSGAGHNGKGLGRPTPAQTIVYHTCRECEVSTVGTDEGRVEVDADRVREVAADANRVEIPAGETLTAVEPLELGIDRPNSPQLTRQVLHRDGLRCANPGCNSKQRLQAHHKTFRSQGGRSELANEVTVCARCHSLLHAGRLKLSGSPLSGWVWSPQPISPNAKLRDTAALCAEVRARVAELAEATADGPQRPAAEGGGVLDHSLAAAPAGICAEGSVDYGGQLSAAARRGTPRPRPRPVAYPTEQLDEIAHSLRRLGYSKSQANDAVRDAYASLMRAASSEAEERRASGGETQTVVTAPSDEEILLCALRGNWQ